MAKAFLHRVDFASDLIISVCQIVRWRAQSGRQTHRQFWSMRYAACNMTRWTLVLLLAACGGSSDKDVKKPVPPGPQSAVPDAAPVGEEPKAKPAIDSLSSEECLQLFDHVFQLAVADQQSLPIEERPTAADIEKAKAQMRGQLVPDCLTMSRAELKYDCYMAASDRADIAACDKKAKQLGGSPPPTPTKSL